MKKYISILIIAIMLILGLFLLTGCGDKEETNNNEQANTLPSEQEAEQVDASGFLGTKTGKFYNQFSNNRMYMEYEMEYDGQNTKVISATDGQKIYSESIVDGSTAGVSIIDGDTLYTIDHNSKMVIKMSNSINTTALTGAILEENDINMENLKTGTRDIDGKTYETEEWVVEGETVIMCFDGDDLAYMLSAYEGEEMTIKVLKTSNTVDDKLFEIPSDYQVMEM